MTDEKELFLHGVCGVFALALHEKFGYKIGWAVDNDEDDEEESLGNPWLHLLHVFCVDGDRYIDVRGILEGDEALLDEFEDFFDAYLIAKDVPVEKLLEELHTEMPDDALEEYLEQANAIIDAEPSAYMTRTEDIAP